MKTHRKTDSDGGSEISRLKFSSVEHHQQRRFADSTVAQQDRLKKNFQRTSHQKEVIPRYFMDDLLRIVYRICFAQFQYFRRRFVISVTGRRRRIAIRRFVFFGDAKSARRRLLVFEDVVVHSVVATRYRIHFKSKRYAEPYSNF